MHNPFLDPNFLKATKWIEENRSQSPYIDVRLRNIAGAVDGGGAQIILMLGDLAAHRDTRKCHACPEWDIYWPNRLETSRLMKGSAFNVEQQCSLRTPSDRASLRQRARRELPIPCRVHSGWIAK